MNPIDELNKMIAKHFTYKSMTEEEYRISCVNDISEWAEEIAGQWHDSLRARDNDPDEDRAHCADDIIEKCNELKELIAEMGEL